MINYITKLLDYGYTVQTTDYYGLVLVNDKWHGGQYTCFKDKLKALVLQANTPESIRTAIQESLR